ncbi:holo-ACP synthase [Litorimonas sp. WD9-15]|uniref:holo-ACP synthase n=1 Tax=Litorimonas sp. WD9-15 TaxID=3418716 RepID=UPI003D04C985
MILGIGTDICDIRRIEQSIEKHGERFLAKTFTQIERDYCNSKARPAMSYAKRFAAKEAVAKALAGAETGALPWHAVEVRNDPSGRPVVTLSGKAESRLQSYLSENQSGQIHLSLSDDYPYATAFAIAEAVPAVRETS